MINFNTTSRRNMRRVLRGQSTGCTTRLIGLKSTACKPVRFCSYGTLTALLGGILLFGSNEADAQVVTFNTTGTTTTTSTNTNFNATQQATGVSGTPTLARSGDLGILNGTAGTFTTSVTATSNFTDTLDISKTYVGFSVVPAAGNVLFATSIATGTQGTNAAPNSYAIAYSTDGFATFNSTSVTGVTSTSTVTRTFDITDLITSDTLSVRLLNYGSTRVAGGSAPASGGGFRISSPIVNGSTVATAAGAIALAANTEIRNSGALTLGGTISGGSAIIKTGAGTLTLTGNNSYSGATTVTAGTLSATGAGANQALGGTTSVAVNNGATLSLGADNQIKSTAGFALGSANGSGAAAFNVGSHLQTVGALTLNASASITLGGGTSSLTFADSSASTFAAGATLSILNYAGLVYEKDLVTTSGTAGDTLFFGATSGGLTSTQLAQVTFVNPAGYTGNFPAFINGSGEVFAVVPEPTTILGGSLLLGVAVWSQRRRLCGSLRTV